MFDPDKSQLNWDIQLNFDIPQNTEVTAPLPPKISPRKIIGEKFPQILARIEQLWCTLALHNYLQQILFTDRLNRQGFPQDVLQALGEIHVEHVQILKQRKIIKVDIWDMYFKH